MFYLLLAILMWIVTACTWLSPEIPVPSYIHIPGYTFQASEFQGGSSHKIVDAWVFVNGKKIGAFQLPATIPVLESGECEIITFPGILLNGIAATRAIYVFYKPDTFHVQLRSDSIVTLYPSSTYEEYTTFQFIENFESVGLLFTKSSRSDTTINIIDNPQDVFDGARSGEVVLTRTRDYFEAYTIESYELPRNKFSFLEIDCKSTINFVVGLIIHEFTSTTMHPIVIITPSNSWKKIYVNLTPVISRFPSSSKFSIFLSAEYDSGVQPNRILFDNIKLLHN